MEKRNKIIYWIATIWLSLGMTSSAIVQLLRLEEETKSFSALGYPEYLMSILAVWKLAGVLALLLPRLPLLKEWAYAGFVFVMSGAAISHIIMHHPATEILPSVFLLILTGLSWYFRPETRRALIVKLS
jgi:hypothetical protein